MSPILVRPVREQLEHDRVIRLLQAKFKRKFEVGINPGAVQAVPVASGNSTIFPDVVLQSTERSRKLLGVIEVETSESVNHLEALSQWVPLGRLRVPFQLYVPAGSIDTTRRLCTDHAIGVTEVWTFHPVGDQMRFTLIVKPPQSAPRKTPARSASSPQHRTRPAAKAKKPASRPSPKSATRSRTARAAPKPASRSAVRVSKGRTAAKRAAAGKKRK